MFKVNIKEGKLTDTSIGHTKGDNFENGWWKFYV
jgi:hypothetical protein